MLQRLRATYLVKERVYVILDDFCGCPNGNDQVLTLSLRPKQEKKIQAHLFETALAIDAVAC
jgi:hypothetical protein